MPITEKQLVQLRRSGIIAALPTAPSIIKILLVLMALREGEESTVTRLAESIGVEQQSLHRNLGYLLIMGLCAKHPDKTWELANFEDKSLCDLILRRMHEGAKWMKDRDLVIGTHTAYVSLQQWMTETELPHPFGELPKFAAKLPPRKGKGAAEDTQTAQAVTVEGGAA